MLGIIIALLLLGILLLLLEIIFVPGTTIVGIGGLVLMAIGIYLAYDSVSLMAGHLSVGVSLAVIVLGLVVLLKGKTWEKMALKDSVSSKVEAVNDLPLKVGDQGVTAGRLNPAGKANFGDLTTEVHSIGEFIDNDTPIEVIRITDNRVLVKSLA